MSAIYKKIGLVMKDIEYLAKDSHVKFGQQDYKAISEERVTAAVRKSMVEHGLVIFPVKTDYVRNGNIGQVHVTYKIADTDTGESIEVQSVGEGADTQDKASGKAQTYAFKYALLRTFAIPTGEDPDKVSSAELDAKEKKTDTNRRNILIAKWKTLGGEEGKFETWYKDQQDKGFNEHQMERYLTKKLQENAS